MLVRREDFGNIDILKNGSHKKIWFTCDVCYIGILQRWSTYIKQKDGKFCRSCRNKHTANKIEVKIKQSNASKNMWKSKKHRRHMSIILSKECKKSWDNDDGTRRNMIHNKTKYKKLKEMLEVENYRLLTTEIEYKNPTKKERKIKIVCPKEHIYETYIRRWNKGTRCAKCLRVDWKRIKKSFLEKGYIIISNEEDYVNNNTKIKYRCPNEHEHNMSWSAWIGGTRCAKCSSHISKGEMEIHEYIKEITDCDIKTNDRLIISPQELDVVIPSKNIAIEYCGLYWHSEKRGKDRKYHLNKFNRCLDKGYRLLTIFEDEWNNNKKLVKKKLLHILGGSKERRVYARKCGIVEIESHIASKFCKENHIQGYTGASIKLGLYYMGELLAVMTFAKPSLSKGNKKGSYGIWELSRYCTKCNVIGGAGKMFKFFQRNYLWNEIFSFADKRWSDGNLYHKLEFEKMKDTKPNYFYFYKKQNYKDYKRYHRFNFRKQELKNKLDTFDPNKTEYENMLMNDWDRIWDCGNMKFVIKPKKP